MRRRSTLQLIAKYMPEVLSFEFKKRRHVTRDHGTHLLARTVVADAIGRKLKGYELVHHIDGNTLNDDLSNLAIVSRSEHNKLHASKWYRELFPPESVAELIARTSKKF